MGATCSCSSVFVLVFVSVCSCSSSCSSSYSRVRVRFRVCARSVSCSSEYTRVCRSCSFVHARVRQCMFVLDRVRHCILGYLFIFMFVTVHSSFVFVFGSSGRATIRATIIIITREDELGQENKLMIGVARVHR